jgi:hypothetical protein
LVGLVRLLGTSDFEADFDPSLQHPDPIGVGLAMEAVAEAAGPECIVPGQHAPLRLMGIKVPIHPSPLLIVTFILPIYLFGVYYAVTCHLLISIPDILLPNSVSRLIK